MRLVLFTLLTLTTAACGAGDASAIPDPRFNWWCGTALCDWELEAGTWGRVSTWHRSDTGVELIENPTVISQLVDMLQPPPVCIEFAISADRHDQAALTLELDFQDDGTVEASKSITSTEYKQQSFILGAPGQYDTVRVRLTKQGQGRVVLALVRGESGPGCDPEVRGAP